MFQHRWIRSVNALCYLLYHDGIMHVAKPYEDDAHMTPYLFYEILRVSLNHKTPHT